jgi:chemotaxis signal transduction protein
VSRSPSSGKGQKPTEPGEVERLRQEIAALRQALDLQSAVEELPETFDTLVGSIGDERLAVPLRHVLEVVPRVFLSPLPEAPAHVAGYMRWRGAHVPVVDMGRHWTGEPLPVRLEDRIVVVRRGPNEVRGLLVSEVEGVARIEKNTLHPARADAPGASWALGFLQQAERPLLLVSLEKLLHPLAGLLPPGTESRQAQR